MILILVLVLIMVAVVVVVVVVLVHVLSALDYGVDFFDLISTFEGFVLPHDVHSASVSSVWCLKVGS